MMEAVMMMTARSLPLPLDTQLSQRHSHDMFQVSARTLFQHALNNCAFRTQKNYCMVFFIRFFDFFLQIDFAVMYTDPHDSKTLLLELPESFVSNSSRPVLISAVFGKGTFASGLQQTLYHMPAETEEQLSEYSFHTSHQSKAGIPSSFNTEIQLVIVDIDLHHQLYFSV
jgi:hypothetical protein